ncbi:hypothetical protein DI005_23300 [Prauserella sp. PE36]|uniref:ESX-1 secretion-associated protein EspA/EspE-like domain-containing protein n=1 Tax=Prauserella endophytica TaxID=1592324 RepID=A0ABY2S9K5_9PSEU|nr:MULTISPECIES: hypothetical protein [Prauserella]PXY23021.1 hypothetical protein BAY59_25195 [Prauserella coralliicola]RBM17214.1 hypothetical protein DI005_23300 [Prauserella sp. PE36]TKG72580.1 hypothetical protein FCN18_04860 [Prauserella endophytica]
MSSSIVSDDPSSDNPLVDSKTDATNQYDMLQSDASAAAGLALVASSLSPAALAVTVPLGAATGQFDNLGSGTELAQGTSVSTVIDAVNQVKSGDWASALASGSALASDVLGAVADPIGAVAGQLIGWMLEHVEPLRMVLHQLTGNPDMVQGYADTWTNISGRMAEQGEDYLKRVPDETGDWSGEGGDAYRASAVSTIQLCAGAAQGADAVSSAAAKMKDVVAAVRTAVRDILADLAGGLVSAAIQAATVVLAPGAVKTIITRIAKAGIDIANWITKLAVVISRLSAVIVDLLQALDELERAERAGR